MNKYYCLDYTAVFSLCPLQVTLSYFTHISPICHQKKITHTKNNAKIVFQQIISAWLEF